MCIPSIQGTVEPLLSQLIDLYNLLKYFNSRGKINVKTETEEDIDSQEEDIVENTLEETSFVDVNVAEEPTTSTSPDLLQTRTFDSISELMQEDVVATEDADKSFLISLLPDYRKLTYEQKIDFRLHTLQFFRNITLNNC